MKDGRRLASGPCDARGGPENPLREDEILAKFHDYAIPAIGASRARALADAARRLVEPGSDFTPVLDWVCRS